MENILKEAKASGGLVLAGRLQRVFTYEKMFYASQHASAEEALQGLAILTQEQVGRSERWLCGGEMLSQGAAENLILKDKNRK